jgi:hypothetical protein
LTYIGSIGKITFGMAAKLFRGVETSIVVVVYQPLNDAILDLMVGERIAIKKGLRCKP